MARYWFRPKRYGYGATPCTWQGWAATLISVVALILAVRIALLLVHDQAPRVIAILAATMIIVVPFCWLAHAKTEGGWRWRRGEDD